MTETFTYSRGYHNTEPSGRYVNRAEAAIAAGEESLRKAEGLSHRFGGWRWVGYDSDGAGKLIAITGDGPSIGALCNCGKCSA